MTKRLPKFLESLNSSRTLSTGKLWCCKPDVNSTSARWTWWIYTSLDDFMSKCHLKRHQTAAKNTSNCSNLSGLYCTVIDFRHCINTLNETHIGSEGISLVSLSRSTFCTYHLGIIFFARPLKFPNFKVYNQFHTADKNQTRPMILTLDLAKRIVYKNVKLAET